MTASGWHRKNLNTPAELERRKRYNSAEHKAARQHYAAQVAAGQAICWRCGRPIPTGSIAGRDWHVGHSDDGQRIMGAEHSRSCNLKAAAVKGARTTNAQRQGKPTYTPPQYRPEPPRAPYRPRTNWT